MCNINVNQKDFSKKKEIAVVLILCSCAGLHELDALQDQEAKDFRSKMKRISEEKMQSVQMMSWVEWLQSCFSPQIEVGPVDGLCDRNEGWIKITMHYNQSQVYLQMCAYT